MPEHYQVGGRSAAEISASIERGVVRGDLVFGSPLPPIRSLAVDLGVSPATVAKAYQELRHRGVVEAAGRRGTRVRSRPPLASSRSAMRLPVPDGMLDLSTGEPDLRLLPPLGRHLRALAAHADDPVGYARAGALPELGDVARSRLAADGVPVDDAAICVTSGALDAIERLLSTHLKPGDPVAVEDPGWANLLDLLAALDLRPFPMAVDDEGPTHHAMARALSQGVRAVVVTARAQNPTGASISAGRAAELRAMLATRPGVLVIEDDHAAELAGVPLHCLGPVTGTWAFVRSASKPFGPDLRVAVLAGDEDTVARLAGRVRTGAGWVSTVLQRLLLTLWADDRVEAAITRAEESYRHRRLGLLSRLADRGVPASGATGINVWAEVPDETRAVTALRDQGFAAAAGALYRLDSSPGLRITVSPLDEHHLDPLADAIAGAARPARPTAPAR